MCALRTRVSPTARRRWNAAVAAGTRPRLTTDSVHPPSPAGIRIERHAIRRALTSAEGFVGVCGGKRMNQTYIYDTEQNCATMHTGPPRRGADAAAALLAQPGAPCPAPLAGAHPLCETRIREIPRCSAISGSCGLGVRRRDETPGPGAYGLPAPLGRASHHRPMTPSDGPRPLVHGEESLRQREMQRQLVGSRPSTGGGGGQQLQPPPQFRPRRPFSATVCRAASAHCTRGRWKNRAPCVPSTLDPNVLLSTA
jgi:hypothetical protein